MRCSVGLWSRARDGGRRGQGRVVLLIITLLAISPRVAAQARGTDNVDPQTLQALIQRIDQLEARVRQLEAERQAPAATPAPAAAPAPAAEQTIAAAPPIPPLLPRLPETVSATPLHANPPQEPTEPPERTENERMDVSKTLLRIRGYGDVDLHGDNYPGDTTSFSLGELNLFITSDISENFRFLSELVFEAEATNDFKAEPERILLQYSYNDYFNLAAGRYHTAIGYYNTTYHHSTWLQTTTDRPFIFQFEDEGGILPIHNVGVSASGLIPSGNLGLHYVAEVGNGRASRTPFGPPDENGIPVQTGEPVQNTFDENNHKAVNFELFSRPINIPGLQTGFSIYRDLLTPLGAPPVHETIVDGHVIYTRTNFEWLNEALAIRHGPEGVNHVFETPAFYSQISRAFGLFRPYFRYDYVNVSRHEPIFADVGLRAGPSVGMRYDASESVALKFQYDYTALRDHAASQGLTLQAGFTF
jgi:hypothetical protein